MARRSSRARKRPKNTLRIVVVGVLIIVGLAAGLLFTQRASVNVDELMQRAGQQYERGEFQAAVIDLKTVLKSESNNRDARFLLARAYVMTGNAEGALKEFRRARKLGVRDPGIGLGIARALLQAGKFEEAATEIAINGDSSDPDWLVLQATLELGQQRHDEARSGFAAALELDPGNEEARRGLMRAELMSGNAERARNEVVTLLETRADDVGLWIIKGDIEVYDNELKLARESYARALELQPKNPTAHIAMARALVGLGELDAAAGHLDELGTAGAEDPRVNFLRARVAQGRGDTNSALFSLRQVLQVVPLHHESLVLAARLHFTQSEYTRAQDYVSRILEVDPGNEAAQRMLGAIQLAAGHLDGLDNLAGATAIDPESTQDPGMLALLGAAYLKHGKFDDSEASLERAAELAPNSLAIRTQLALSRLSNGDSKAAIAELEAILAEDPSFEQSEIMLAMAHLSVGAHDAALGVARSLLSKQPDSALAHNVHGYVLEATENLTTARGAYETAVSKDASFHPARINLARLAVVAGDSDSARQHFQDVLDLDPFHQFALIGLAALALQNDELDEAERLWIVAREQNPDAVAPRLLLAKHYRTKNNRPLAEAAIKEAYRLAPYAPQVQAEYATIMLELGEYEDALQAAQLLIERVPNSLLGLELLARVYNQLGDEPLLTETLTKIAEIAPEAVDARVLLGRLAIRREDFEGAQAIVAELQAADGHQAVGRELGGDLYVARNELDLARADYAKALELKPTTAVVLKLNNVERTLGLPAGRLDKWLETHPDDLQARLVRASYLHQQGSGEVAIPEYEKMLREQEENPIVLNNLAWLYHESNDKRALELARRAHALAPDSPEILDTYGWILYAEAQHEQGLAMLAQAAKAGPDNPDIIFHYASALHASGETEVARAKLETIVENQEEFVLRDDALALLAEMSEKPADR